MRGCLPVSRQFSTLVLSILLSACGGGGGGGSSTQNPPAGDSGGSGWQQGVFLPSETFAARCVAPRSGTDPSTGRAYADVAGTALDEKNWLRSWTEELYLWYDEVEDRDPADYEVLEYFDLLVTNELTETGARKDNFHFSLPTDQWQSQAQSGVAVGYGFQWAIIEARPPRDVAVAYWDQEGQVGLPPRGTRVVTVDGVDVVWADDEASVDTLNAAFFPGTVGEEHTFTFEYADQSRETVTLTARALATDPVQHVRVLGAAMGRKVGYLLFTDHIATAESELKSAVETLAAENIDELVLDLRYNGGGLLAIASQLAYMVAGEVPTSGRVFEELVFNDKYPETNPVTGEPLQPMPFFDTTLGFSSLPNGLSLPALNLQRVFVLTGASTCSASEAIINGLRGVDVEVVQVGSTTCGKPYGFYPTDNCGTTYFSIQFQGQNDKGFGDYPAGFTPGGTGPAGVTGCQVADDFSRDLGDTAEWRLSAALSYIETGSCEGALASASSFRADEGALNAGGRDVDARVLKPVWYENRILDTRGGR
ncbi:peptidase [Microbulbifer flavimaris]|uniref:Peptidase n=1 Tax=Microbulbifer flavimaris TaxID=1781068 RepID=A0ABX4HXE4_9GAMM|nr:MULTISPECIES: S41 family peptidase [Microbulbifer]KUJ82531.1 peptidase [Microbulbifer sp. ZGT114]PCO04741.1 peptidase [Microbulbifer flavimaris]